MKQSTVADCSKDFAKVLVNPVEYDGKLPCMPATLLPLPTWKVRIIDRIVWSVGTGGAGWLILSPQRSLGTNVSGQKAIQYTTSSYAGTAGSGLTPGGAGTAEADFQVPFTLDGSTYASYSARLVAIGTKTIVTTPGLNRGGKLYSYVHPDRADVTANSSNNLIARMGVNTVGVGANSTEPFYSTHGGPRFPSDLDIGLMITSGTTWVPSGTAPGWNHAIMMTSSEPQSLETELVGYWEVIKPSGATLNTVSHSEPGTAGAANSVVWDYLARNPSRDPLAKSQGRLMGLIHEAWRSLGHVDVDAVVQQSLRAAGVFAKVNSGDYLGAAALAASPQTATARGAPRARPAKQSKK